MMAPHSKRNRTCRASCKNISKQASRTGHYAPPPLYSHWLNPGVQPITCCQTCLLLAGGSVRHALLRTEVCQWCLSTSTFIVPLQLHNAVAGHLKQERIDKTLTFSRMKREKTLIGYVFQFKTGTTCGLAPHYIMCNMWNTHVLLKIK